MEKKEEDEAGVTTNVNEKVNKLNRFVFFSDDFSMFDSFSQKTESDTKKEFLGTETTELPEKTRCSIPLDTIENLEDDLTVKISYNATSFQRKISLLSLPLRDSITANIPSESKEASPSRKDRTRTIESIWLSDTLSDVDEKDNINLFAQASNPNMDGVSSDKKTKSIQLHVETRSPSNGARSPKYNNPVIEPTSCDYQKFNKLFRGIENRTIKKLDPSRYNNIALAGSPLCSPTSKKSEVLKSPNEKGTPLRDFLESTKQDFNFTTLSRHHRSPVSSKTKILNSSQMPTGKSLISCLSPSKKSYRATSISKFEKTPTTNKSRMPTSPNTGKSLASFLSGNKESYNFSSVSEFYRKKTVDEMVRMTNSCVLGPRSKKN